MCYSELHFKNNLNEQRKYAACLSLVNHRMVFGKDLYGVANIKSKTERISKIYSNLNHLSKFNNPYIELYQLSSSDVREVAPWIRFYSVNLLTNSVRQDTRERPNENQYRLKSAQIPGLSYICLGYNGGLNPNPRIYYTSVINGSIYPLYNTKNRYEAPIFNIENIGYFESSSMTYNSSTTANGMYTMGITSYAWSANQLFSPPYVFIITQLRAKSIDKLRRITSNNIKEKINSPI
jgi:hypothetical protein